LETRAPGLEDSFGKIEKGNVRIRGSRTKEWRDVNSGGGHGEEDYYYYGGEMGGEM
jgi:hypothetical protein